MTTVEALFSINMMLRICVTVKNAGFNSVIVVAVTWKRIQATAPVSWGGVLPKIMALCVKTIAIA